MTMTTILDLPRDLVEEIVYRLPLKSVRAVILTCKTFYTLSKSKNLTKIPIGKAAAREGESQMIVLMDHNLHLMSIVVNEDPSAELIGKRTCLTDDSEQVKKISQVFHCEGLVLCIFKDDIRFVVWNPYLGQTRWIKPRFSHRIDGCDRFSYALGYEKSCRSVKFLRFIDYFYNAPGNRFFWYEIYDLDSGLWTTLDVTPYWCIRFDDLGVSLKGNTYWCTTTRDSPLGLIDHIICFDFTSERFGPLLRLPFTARHECLVTLSCFREEKLAALFYHDQPIQIEIWIATKIKAKKVLWSKFLTLDVGGNLINPFQGSFFIDEVNKVAMLFETTLNRDRVIIIGEDGYVRDVDLGEPADQKSWLLVCPYAPILVQIKQPSRCKRKRQSSLESRLYNRNMVRLVSLETERSEVENFLSISMLRYTHIYMLNREDLHKSDPYK